jgi:hypothetical protein
MIYDFIIIGAGISGLYCAYKLLLKNPNLKLLILEKNSKKDIGGRVGNYLFEGVSVVKGAGIGRKNKDNLLHKLLTDLNININEFQSSYQYSKKLNNICNVKNIFNLLKKQYKNYNLNRNKTFKQFATKILGKDKYKNFVICSGYSDYENADIYDTLYNYGFDDNYNEYTGFSVNWKLLVKKLIDKINIKHIKTNSNVIKIIKNNNDSFLIISNKDKFFLTKNIIIATTVQTVKKLLPQYKIYKNIDTNSFLRIYAKFSKKSILTMKKYVFKYTIVNTKLQKIIPINSDKGIYMIGYCDNKNADYLIKKINNFKYFENLIKKSLNIEKTESIKIKSMKDFYWKYGTHYYLPLNNKYKNRKDFINKAQFPCNNIYIVGEMISLNQGWTNSALLSCEKILQRF